ncbi:hypothetical protein [Sporosarcina highlanderae]|uniref:Phage protein n=1 Tax=Sporosarcina highlanderae TaxID=3035916 RepID=A0ABT8JW92_9BACL|nr:hypothetical protein [Sporosarcina highlanderae]MDN4609127.1 hypothetical protein [Sporosarcina highlanderae]
MKFQVINRFRDTKDKGHIYEVGDKYPRKGRLNKERAETLAGTSNKYGYPFIEEIEEIEEVEENGQD